MTTTTNYLRKLQSRVRNKAAVDRGLKAKPEKKEPIRLKIVRKDLQQDYEVAPTWIDKDTGQWISFHGDQLRAWNCEDAIIAICAGWQSGKTWVLGWWLRREIQRRGPGDYGAFSSTFPILNKKFLPILKQVFASSGPAKLRIAEWKSGDSQFVLTPYGEICMWGETQEERTIIQVGYAARAEALESATLKGVIWDEPGMRIVKEASFRTIMSRVMVHRGRICMASRPYEPGWYERLCTKAMGIACTVIEFATWANPFNPSVDDPYWVPIRKSMPDWMFDMMYAGKFTRPAGLIYSTFDYQSDTCEDFDLSHRTKDGSFLYRFMAFMDFGSANMAGLIGAFNIQTKELLIIADYLPQRALPYAKHVENLEKLLHLKVPQATFSPGCGGNRSGEEGTREAFRMHGLPMDAPSTNDVKVGIQSVFNAVSTKKVKFFRMGAAMTIDHMGRYSYEVDEDGKPTQEIENKSQWHLMDCLRAGILHVYPPVQDSAPSVGQTVWIPQVNPEADLLI